MKTLTESPKAPQDTAEMEDTEKRLVVLHDPEWATMLRAVVTKIRPPAQDETPTLRRQPWDLD
jgi:hypothetical protein